MVGVLSLILFYILLFNIIKYYYSVDENLTLSSEKVDVIVSLTSTPSRINDSKRTIISILKQSYLPKEIIFNIPYFSSKNEEYFIPDWLIRLSKKYPFIKLNRCEKDYGPATKIIPTLEIYKYKPEQKILYIDDDMIYHQNFIKHFYEASLEHENEVICNTGYNINNFRYINNIGPYFLLFIFLFLIILLSLTSYLFVKENWISLLVIYSILIISLFFIFSKDEKVDVVEGWAGVLVKPKFFDLHQVLDYNKYPKEVFFDDDVYLSGHLNNNNIQKYMIKFYGVPLPTYHKNFFNTLSFSSNSNNENKKKSHLCFNWN